MLLICLQMNSCYSEFMLVFSLRCCPAEMSGVDSIVKQIDSEKIEEHIHGVSNNARDQAPCIDNAGSEKLLFSVFSLLQNLGADERPEVK